MARLETKPLVEWDWSLGYFDGEPTSAFFSSEEIGGQKLPTDQKLSGQNSDRVGKKFSNGVFAIGTLLPHF